jgi:hypothetical protein
MDSVIDIEVDRSVYNYCIFVRVPNMESGSDLCLSKSSEIAPQES